MTYQDLMPSQQYSSWARQFGFVVRSHEDNRHLIFIGTAAKNGFVLTPFYVDIIVNDDQRRPVTP